jgi:hypothetical protein
MEQQELINRIKELPQDRVAEVAAFVESLAQREHTGNRMNLHQALSDYAIQHAGTTADLDPELEAAASDLLLKQDLGQ